MHQGAYAITLNSELIDIFATELNLDKDELELYEKFYGGELGLSWLFLYRTLLHATNIKPISTKFIKPVGRNIFSYNVNSFDNTIVDMSLLKDDVIFNIDDSNLLSLNSLATKFIRHLFDYIVSLGIKGTNVPKFIDLFHVELMDAGYINVVYDYTELPWEA